MTCVRGGRASTRPTTLRGFELSGVVLDERQDRGDVAAVDEGRAGQDRLAATEDIAVLLKEIELCDGHVALQVGLLVDVELDLAVLHSLRQVRVGVEGADLGLAPGTLAEP